MNHLLETLKQHGSARRMAIALQGSDIALDYYQLQIEIAKCQQLLAELSLNATVAMAINNHPAWVVIDLAALTAALPIVPIPPYFTDAQIGHAITDAGANVLITDNAERFKTTLTGQILAVNTITIAGLKLEILQLNIATKSLPKDLIKDTVKITYTSGSTGAPKGVCISAHAQWQVANVIKNAAQLTSRNQHLCVLPLATLLENVAGVYATLLAGGTAHVLPAAQTGFNGNHLDISQLIQTLNALKANTAIFIPALLSALVLTCEADASDNKSAIKLPHLRFLAVGGAHVSTQLLQRAHKLGLPVFEGYGLSECASVVALNTANHHKIGSVGKVLPHAQIKIADDGEILVKGAQFLGYTNSQHMQQEWLATGDIGFLDDNDFLHINGRKKNMFITSFGRNVSPEWLETTLCEQAAILQACVFGEAKPCNVAVVVSNYNKLKVTNAIKQANKNLPDYAQIKYWLMADAPFSVSNQQLTANNRLKRDVILQAYVKQIDELYLI